MGRGRPSDEGHEGYEGHESHEEGHESHEGNEGHEGHEEGHEGHEGNEGHEGHEEVKPASKTSSPRCFVRRRSERCLVASSRGGVPRLALLYIDSFASLAR